MTLRIIRAAEGETVNRTGAPIFEGTVHGRTLVDAKTSKDVSAALVHFSAGARTRFHRHTSDQLLIVLNGIGRVGDREHDHVIATGDSVLISAGTEHWHGAGDSGSPMTHISITRPDSESTVL